MDESLRTPVPNHKKTASVVNEYSNSNPKSVLETSIYQRFKQNSHKIFIEPAPVISTSNGRISQVRSSLNLHDKSLAEIPEKNGKKLGLKDRTESGNSLKDIEKRILKKMKRNKTDRKERVGYVLNKKETNDKPEVVSRENSGLPDLGKVSSLQRNRPIRSPGSDIADNSFPKLANSSFTSAYSTPYGKDAQISDMRAAMNRDRINEAMSRIKKSVVRSQSIRKSDLSQASNSVDYTQNRRETPYDNPSILGKSRHYSDTKNLMYPQVYKSYEGRPKADMQAIKLNISKMLENNKSLSSLNRRYEMDTADTETSFLKSPSVVGSQADRLSVPHNEYFDNQRTPGIKRKASKSKNLAVAKSISIKKDKGLKLTNPLPSIKAQSKGQF